ncbi:winged helix-turn-helix domain-containing protein [Rhodanobacter sp. AS-Z3]|uniref:tetratricopeptide repeat protein n=1 Tax=Rhodanobacter sp. AS-Z3 TaxID=3031330 RepID=UPI00247A84E7|nr:winged helix-turn-helix domain-containing protein [Rhodanobacter sp. AS-Z3]WEN15559.1 winged helix-turn-helix domain-containing protein [Rhodanobacter sp. AS-Z3]
MTQVRLLDLIVDTAGQQVTRDDARLDVAGLNFHLLACLIAHGDAVVDIDTLMADVWAPAVVNEETVTQRVKLLRQALGDDSRQPRYIRSVRGKGYQLCRAPVPIAASRNARGRWFAAAAVVVIAGVIMWMTWPKAAVTPDLRSPLVRRAAYYAAIGQSENNERAISLYQQALQANPDDGDALLGLSRASSARACLFNGSRADTDQGHALARRVLEREPSNAAAWSALAYAQDCSGRIDDAIASYERAIALNASDNASRASVAYLYQEKGRLADALRMNLQLSGDASRVRFRDTQIARELELLGFVANAQARLSRIFQLDPDNVFANIAWPRCLYLQGRYDDAQLALEASLARHTPHVDLYVMQGELALQRHDRAGAAAAFRSASKLRPEATLPQTLAAIYGEPAAPPAWIEQRIAALKADMQAGQPWPGSMLEVALLELARGDKDAAVAAIARAVDAGFPDRAYLQVSPLFEKLAGEAGFERQLARISDEVARQRQQVLTADWKPADLPPPKR